MLIFFANVFLLIVPFIAVTLYHLIVYCCKIFYYGMEPDVAKYMRTERKPGSLDVHPTLDAIVLTYDIDVQILGAKENPIHGEKRTLKKTIELPMINSRTDHHALAREVVNQCDLIHLGRLAEVEQIIFYLKKRKLQGGPKGDGDYNGNKENNHQDANYNNLPDYIDLLYEGMTEKIKGATLIQALARDPDNLEALSKNETLISALARVLREDWKRSISLSTSLVFTFFCFSMFSCFRDVILKCKVGSICMEIIDFELRRYDKWKAELEGAEAPSDAPIVKKPCPNSASLSEIPRSRIPEPVRPRSGNFSDANIKAAMDGSIYDDLTTSMESFDDKLTGENKAKRFRTLVRKQDHLLRVAYYLLLNIAEDETVEEKMSKRNIVGLLVKALDRENDELLALVTTFLKKLSLMHCNKEAMVSYNIVEKFPKMLESNSVNVVHLTLILMFNLSFDTKVRNKIIKTGILPRIVTLMGDHRHQEVVLKLLYNLSVDDETKDHFIDCIGLIIDMLLLNVSNDGDRIMIALCVNLATHPLMAQQIIKNNRLQALVMRAFEYQDSMLMKMLKNVSHHRNVSGSFIEFVGDISKAVVESNNTDFVRECVGILSNMYLPDLDWAEIFKHFDMTRWIKHTLVTNNSDAELVLQVIVLLGTAGTDEGCAKLMCESNIVDTLIDLLKSLQEDDEIVLQIVYAFYVILWHDCNMEYLIEKTEVPAYLIDLLQDDNKFIRKICNMCLNIISEHSKAWADRIRIEKFRHHNAQWLQMVDSQQLEPEENQDDDELPPYLNTEYLSTTIVPPLQDLNEISESDFLDEKELEYDYLTNGHDIDQDLEIMDEYEGEAI